MKKNYDCFKNYIITFHRSLSHGALLQCLASQQFLKENGYNVNILDYRCNAIEQEYRLFKPIKATNANEFLKIIAFNLIDFPYEFKKKMLFKKFRKEYLLVSKNKVKNVDDIKHINDARSFLVGSDQIWNSEITNGLDSIFFLNFDTNVTKVSLAASIGKDSLEEQEQKRIIELVKTFDFVTVREESTKDILSKEIKQVNVICDPVFLTKKDYWIKIATSKRVKKEHYILVYNLSGDALIYEFAKSIKNQSIIIDIARNGIVRLDKKIKQVFAISPDELLSYIYYADLVLTNSFHGTAFSIILEKQFMSFGPKKRKGRINELLLKCNLQKNMFDQAKSFENNYKNIYIDYKNNNESIKKFSNCGRKIMIDVLTKINNYE